MNLADANSLISIGTVAFQNTLLETLIMPINSSLEVISAQSFQNTNLSGYLIIPSSVHTINGVSFSGTKITEFYIPLSVTTITGNMFPSNKATIRYEGSSVPPGWAANWNSHNHTVIYDALP